MNIVKGCNSYPISLFVTGQGVEEAVQKYCNEVGLCVTVTETNYIFTGGSEKGYIIGLINYPRFPREKKELVRVAKDLGYYLIEKCNPSGSFTMQTRDYTSFFSNREGD